MPAKYKLTYFGTPGLAEPIRYLLAYGKLEYEEVKVTPAEWEKLKPTTPFGQLPLLEEDGKVISQSVATSRYLAKAVGLAGKTAWDQLQADIIIDTLGDFRTNYRALNYAPEDKKAEKLKEIKEKDNPFYLSKFEKILSENGGTFVKDQLTWADLYFVSTSERITTICGADVLDPYPNVKALFAKVNNLPGIKEHREKR